MEYSVAKASEELHSAFDKRNIKALRKISNRCSESMAIEPDKGMFSLSIISYALGKILGKPRYWRDETRIELTSFVEKKLRECRDRINAGDEEGFSRGCSEIIDYLEEFDVKKRRYVRGLFDKAKLKMAARMYAQGLSLSYVISVTGSDTNEVLDYIGKTLMFDRVGRTKGIKERLIDAEKIFG
ncbi:MAG: hypothetical protein ABIG39_01580 [Candidatus Micrarchaeota archaeon]